MMSMDHFFHLLPEARKVEYLRVIQSLKKNENIDSGPKDSVDSGIARENDDIVNATTSLMESLFECCDLMLTMTPSAPLIISLF